MIKFLEKQSPATLGFLEAAATSTYCGLIAAFFNFMSKVKPNAGLFGFFLILVLFVFSAATCGSLVFGYPAYLAVVKNKIGDAINVLAFCSLWALLIIIITTTLVIVFSAR